MMMKLFILIIVMSIIASNTLSSQTKVFYTYDASGNRTNRTLCFKSTVATNDSNMIVQPLIESLGDLSITLYPNPTKGLLNVKVANMPADAKGEITLCDLTGRLMMRKNEIQETTLIDISSQPSGIFVLRIKVGDKVSEWKVIKE